MSPPRDQFRDFLQVKAGVRRLGGIRGARLRTFEKENIRLKKLLAEAMLDNVVLKDLASNGDACAKRDAVAHAREHHS